jgi:hypothetical protein
MKDIVGEYKGIKVYMVTLPEYVNGRLYKDEENMYLIDRELIYKNEIFAKYDGNYVTEYDPHQRVEYYTIPAINRGVEFSSSIGTADGGSVSNSETKTSETMPISNFKPEDVEATLAGVYEKDYFSGMTDIDVFLKSNLES